MRQRFRVLPFFVLVSLLILPARAQAGTAVLLRDIADDPLSNAGSFVRRIVPFKEQAAFLASIPNAAEGLWVSDGTAAGTHVVFSGCDVDVCEDAPEIFGTVNGFLLFSSASPEGEEDHPRRLWRTDGTRVGTVLLTPDVALPGYLNEGAPIVVTDRFLYFLACNDNGADCAIWRSNGTNGTPAGTAVWKRPAGSGSLSGLWLAGDRLYSVVVENTGDRRLWSADTKTGAETVVASWGYPEGLSAVDRPTAAGGKLFFLAPVADHSTELWVSDGTVKGTKAVTQFEASFPFEGPEWMKAIGGRVYFVANDVTHGFELWRSDGTPQGTVRVSDFGFFEALEDLEPDGVAEVGGKVLFTASDGLTATRLWISDGRAESTAPFRSLCPSADCPLPQSGSKLVPVGTKVFFIGENGLWSTNGTFAGTHRFAGLPCTFECGLQPALQELQGKIAFTTRDVHGIELWTSDGTEAGTRRLTDVPDTSPLAGPTGGLAVAAGPWVYFIARDRHGAEPWVTNGKETRLLLDLNRAAPGSGVHDPTPAGSRVFFTACGGQEGSVWVTSGTPETTAPIPGTTALCNLNSPPASDLRAAGGRLFFTQPDASRVPQIWSTDGGVPVQVTHTSVNDYVYRASAVEFQGRLLVPIQTGGKLAFWQSTAAGDGLVKAIDLPGLSPLNRLGVVGNEIYFLSFGQGSDTGLWRTDLTAGGTRLLKSDFWTQSDFVRLGASVLFIAQSRTEEGNIASGLWKTDGTAAGTVAVQPSLSGPNDPAQELTVLAGNLYFFAPDGVSWGLWRSDGTAAGTVLVRQFADEESFSGGSIRFGLTVFAGKLFFIADDGVHGRELWTSDGTANGTHLVIDLQPGAGPGAPGLLSTLTVAGNRLFFAGNDGIHGTELWESDRTAAGTRLVQDLAPEAAASQPSDLTPFGNSLFFVADDLLTGREPWALPLAGPNGCQPSPTRLCLNGGRYQVEASWLTSQGQSGQSGIGQAVPLSGDTGTFWFFNAANVEAVVKVLDGQGVNGHVWVFYGALSDVEYTITVTDTQTGLTRRYFNPQGTLASVGDTHGFGPLGANAADPEPPVSRSLASPPALVSERKAATGPCVASAKTLCLNGGRFAVEVAWKDFQNHTGTGTAVPLTNDTGTFWFFNSANVELVVKALDGRPVNGHFWLFYGALSNVEYTLTVTDTQTGTVRRYTNPSGRFASVADTGAF